MTPAGAWIVIIDLEQDRMAAAWVFHAQDSVRRNVEVSTPG